MTYRNDDYTVVKFDVFNSLTEALQFKKFPKDLIYRSILNQEQSYVICYTCNKQVKLKRQTYYCFYTTINKHGLWAIFCSEECLNVWIIQNTLH